jgi:energy-coupling factor transporter ATP-binding protein EcfA2
VKLIDVEIFQFRRLQRAKVNFDGKVIAIVGPNEAGKSSLLEALRRIESPGMLARSDFTNREVPSADTEIVQARYLLEDADRLAIGGVAGAQDAIWFLYGLRADGSLFSGVRPPPERDLQPRRQVKSHLDRLLRTKWVKARLAEDPDDDVIAEIQTATNALDSEEQTLSTEVINQLSLLMAALEVVAKSGLKLTESLPDRVRTLIKHESAAHPHDAARRELEKRRPEFLFYGSSERELASEYELAEVADDLPAALTLLARLADLNLIVLRDAVTAEDWGRVETLIDRANSKLRDYFAMAWKQSLAAVRFRIDGTMLRVLVSKDEGGFTPISERSDGLRSFVALVAFTSAYDLAVPPILLIDEAESHLHYDAQADLVQVLTRQAAAAQVLYSTHSAGCLPEDLGTGVRVVEKIPGSDFSRTRNGFWESGPGFTPLLIGMGASALAFAPSRRALIAEGPSELIMLPTLLRHVLERDHLDIQVAPGLSRVNPSSVDEFELQAPRVAYIVDGDKGGSRIARKLAQAGIDDQRIIVLGGANSGLVIEDVLEAGVYEAAINEELRRSLGVNAPEYSCKSKVNRPQEVAQWCKLNQVGVPHKTAVAQRVVEMRSERALVSSERKGVLEEVFRQASALLGL